MFRKVGYSAAFACLSIGSAHATEGGGSAYGNGAEDYMSGNMPPPGTYLLSYNIHYSANKFVSKNPAFDKFNLDLNLTALRLVHVSDKTFFGAHWMMAAFQSYANTDVAVGSAKDRLSAFGDLAIDPFILGWHFTDWNVAAGVDWYIPTGSYNKNRSASPGRNYVTAEPVVAVTYLNSAGYEASAKVMYDYNWENSATHYRSGNELHSDFLLGKHVNQWAFGIGGYAYQQVTDDSGSGATLGGFRGRVYAAGPHVAYNARHFNVTARWNHEFDASNKSEGDQYWLRFVVPI